MFEMEMKNPLDETVQHIENISLYDFEMIELKFNKSFYGKEGRSCDRRYMKIEELDIEKEDWMETYLKIENGLLELIIPKTGKYQIIQQSRSTNYGIGREVGPAMGVRVEFEMELIKVKNI